ncbi:MAG TPA: DUF5698 domain-containing protein [Anaerolineales bacterium]|jgi:uncharacterized protein YebE (UPF0316 family)|nr:DUF5698 domain-containing protein [Anaerolineales bacterium]
MEFLVTPETLLVALGIFLARLINQTLDTIRFMMTIRGRKLVAWIMGFLETTIFIVTLSAVFSDLNNILYIVAYSAGFASGNTIGMLVEERLAIGYMNLRIISSKRGSAIAEKLRKEGYGVTEIPARGKEGTVTLLDVSVRRRQVKKVHDIAQKVDKSAFISSEELRPLWRGYWGRVRQRF